MVGRALASVKKERKNYETMGQAELHTRERPRQLPNKPNKQTNPHRTAPHRQNGTNEAVCARRYCQRKRKIARFAAPTESSIKQKQQILQTEVARPKTKTGSACTGTAPTETLFSLRKQAVIHVEHTIHHRPPPPPAPPSPLLSLTPSATWRYARGCAARPPRGA